MSLNLFFSYQINRLCSQNIKYMSIEYLNTFDVKLSQTVWKYLSQFIAWRVTATPAISPTWSINWANTSGINSWRASLPVIYCLILQCKFTYSCKWLSSPCGGIWLFFFFFYLAGDLSLAMTQLKCSTMKTKCVYETDWIFVTISSASFEIDVDRMELIIKWEVIQEYMFTFLKNMCKIHQTLHFISLKKKKTNRKKKTQLNSVWPGVILHWSCIHSQPCSQRFPMSRIKSFIVIRP